MGVSEEERAEKVLKETMMENFPSLIKDTSTRPKSSTNSKRDKVKAIHMRNTESQINSRKPRIRDNLESTRRYSLHKRTSQ